MEDAVLTIMGGLDIILGVNLVMKIFNLVKWNWWLVLYPLWIQVIGIAGFIAIVLFINRER